MDKELADLINNKGFDRFQNGLAARFSANRIDYSYSYDFLNLKPSIKVELRKNCNVTHVEINENGELYFDHNQNFEQFKNCTEEDFHTMIAHAFIYLRDGNFDYHKIWFEKLEKSV